MEPTDQPPSVVIYGPCFTCNVPFIFDPDDVSSMRIDPETGLPPDVRVVNGRLMNVPCTDEDIARSVQVPLCPRCAMTAAVERRKYGGFDHGNTCN